MTIFIILRDLFEEDVLSALVSPREAIEDIATVTAVILSELLLEHLPQKFVRDANLGVFDDNIGPTPFRFLHLRTLFINCFFHVSLNLFKLCTAIIDELVLSCCFLIDCCHTEYFIYKWFYMDAWNVVIVRQLLCIISLAARWRSRNVDLDGV